MLLDEINEHNSMKAKFSNAQANFTHLAYLLLVYDTTFDFKYIRKSIFVEILKMYFYRPITQKKNGVIRRLKGSCP